MDAFLTLERRRGELMNAITRVVFGVCKAFIVLLCLSTAGYAAGNPLAAQPREASGQSKSNNIKASRLANPTPPPPDARACVVPGAVVAPTKPRSETTAAFKTKRRDRTCLLAAKAAIDRYTRKKLTIIDVRDSDAFAIYRIPASLNIPLHAIKTKSFLKNHPLGIVDDGHRSGRLEGVCAELARQGFRKLVVIDGGLSAWRESNGPMAGDALAQRNLNRLPAEALFGERRYDDWLVINISGKPHNNARKWLPPNVVVLKPSVSVTQITRRIRQARKKNPRMRVLIADESGSGYGKIEQGIKRAGVTRVYYLASGLAAYDVYVARQIAMWNQKDKPLSLPACRG